jgi:hypothetical protein
MMSRMNNVLALGLLQLPAFVLQLQPKTRRNEAIKKSD